jgi:hypothetical protein
VTEIRSSVVGLLSNHSYYIILMYVFVPFIVYFQHDSCIPSRSRYHPIFLSIPCRSTTPLFLSSYFPLLFSSCTFPTCSGTNSPHHKSPPQNRRSCFQNSTAHFHTSCSQSVRKSRPHPRHPSRQWAQQAPSGCRTFRSRPGSRLHSKGSGLGCRSWVHLGFISIVCSILWGCCLTVTCRRAAAVEESVGTGSGACYTSLGVAADIDLGDGGREGGSGRRGLLGGALHHGGWGSWLAGRFRAGEVLEASLRIAVINCSTAPSILATAFVARAFRVVVLRTAVSSKNTRHQRKSSEDRDTHYD